MRKRKGVGSSVAVISHPKICRFWRISILQRLHQGLFWKGGHLKPNGSAGGGRMGTWSPHWAACAKQNGSYFVLWIIWGLHAKHDKTTSQSKKGDTRHLTQKNAQSWPKLYAVSLVSPLTWLAHPLGQSLAAVDHVRRSSDHPGGPPTAEVKGSHHPYVKFGCPQPVEIDPALQPVSNPRPRETLERQWEDHIWEVSGRHVDWEIIGGPHLGDNWKLSETSGKPLWKHIGTNWDTIGRQSEDHICKTTGDNWVTSGRPHLGDSWKTTAWQVEGTWETIGRPHLAWQTTWHAMFQGSRWVTNRKHMETQWETKFQGSRNPARACQKREISRYHPLL